MLPAVNYHVTLHFIGQVEDAAVADLAAAATALEGQATQVQVARLHGYPSPRRARTVVAELHPCPALEEWSDRLRRVWSVTTQKAERKPFTPHVTVARSRRPVRLPVIRGLEGIALGLQPPGLYRSETLAEGARYTPVTAQAPQNE